MRLDMTTTVKMRRTESAFVPTDFVMFFILSRFTFQAAHQAQPSPERQFKPLGQHLIVFFPFIRTEQDILTSIRNQSLTTRCFLSFSSGPCWSTVYASALHVYRPCRRYFNRLQSFGGTGRTSPLSLAQVKSRIESISVTQVITVAASCSKHG